MHRFVVRCHRPRRDLDLLWPLDATATIDNEHGLGSLILSGTATVNGEALKAQSWAAYQPVGGQVGIAIVRETNGTASVLYQYSDSGEPFRAGEIITPHWEQLPGHGPSVAFFGALIVCSAVASVPLLRRRRKLALTPS